MKKIKINPNQVRASFLPDTFDEENRTIDVVWSVGSKGKRYSWSIGEYYEELSMKKGDVDLSRLNNGAPVLKDHRQSIDTQLGVVEKASIKNKEGVATVRFSEREEFQGLINDIQKGVVRNISVGYRVNKYQEVTKKGEETPTYRAVDWVPMEISFVAIGFDDNAKTRSENENEDRSFECELIENGEGDMPENENQEIETRNEETQSTEETPVVEPKSEAQEETREVETPVVDVDAAKQEGAQAEKTRQAEIRKLVKDAGLENSIASELIDGDNTINQARELILNKLSEKNNRTQTQSQNVEVMDVEKRDLVREAATRAILHRNDPKIELKEGDRDFMGGSLLDTAREVLAAEGTSTRGLHGEALAKRALHHSSDFGAILENVTNKSLQSAYDEQPQTWMPFVRETSAKDFKLMSKMQLAEGSGLEKVNEHGEYKRGTLSEGKEQYKVEKFGKILGLTWELLVNDDLDAFARVPAILGRKVRALESDYIYNILKSNPLMGDGVALFHADHANLGTAGAIGETTMTEAKKQMRLQVDADGNLIQVMPKFLIVPAALETVAKKFMTTVSPNKESDVNIFANTMDIIVEARLDAAFGGSDTAWYLAADKGMLDIIELARLGGQGPQMFTREGFDVDGMETKIRYVFGVKAIDHVGLFKNAGA